MDSVWYEFKHAWHALLRRRQFFLVAVATLALGVGVNTLIFQVANETLMRPLPVADAESVVSIANTWNGMGYEHSSLSYPEMVDYREIDVFQDTAGFRGQGFNLSAGDGDPVQASGLLVTSNLLRLLGITPQLGRTFADEDAQVGAEPTVLLGQELFRSRFGADEGVVDSTIEIGGESVRVVGVLPTMAFPAPKIDLWRVAQIDPQAPPARGWRSWTAFARLKPGASVSDAQQAMRAHEQVMKERDVWYSTPEWGWQSSVRGLRDQTTRDLRPIVLLLLAAVGVVALVATTNVANLFLSRVSERRRELAVRTAVGASSWRIAKQVLVEALILSSVGGILGVTLSLGLGRLLRPLLESRINLTSLAFDWRVAAFVLALSLLLGLLLGAVTVPAAMRLSRLTGLRGRVEDRGVAFTRRGLVVGQLAVALALMVTAGLVLRSLDHLLSVESGIDAGNAAKASISLDRGRYSDLETQKAAMEQILAAVRANPTVEAAAATTILPLTNLSDNSVHILDSEQVSSETAVFPQIRYVSAGLFETLSIPLVAGRVLNDGDREGAPLVAVVNLAFASKYYDGDAVGKRFSFGLGEGSRPFEIVGVVANTQEGRLTEEVREVYYLPVQQQLSNSAGDAILVARASNSGLAAEAIRSAVRSFDPLQSLHNEAPLSSLLNDASANERAQTVLLSAFAALTALLAGIGVYGVLSFTLQQERKNVGLRLALGALPQQVVAWMVGKGLVLAGLGVAGGLVLALAAGRMIRSQLYSVSAYDPVIFLAVATSLVGVAGVAAWIPARRAAKVDPLLALRSE